MVYRYDRPEIAASHYQEWQSLAIAIYLSFHDRYIALHSKSHPYCRSERKYIAHTHSLRLMV